LQNRVQTIRAGTPARCKREFCPIGVAQDHAQIGFVLRHVVIVAIGGARKVDDGGVLLARLQHGLGFGIGFGAPRPAHRDRLAPVFQARITAGSTRAIVVRRRITRPILVGEYVECVAVGVIDGD
jgi:hypothetical protein